MADYRSLNGMPSQGRDIGKLELIIELGILKSLAEKVFARIMQSTDEQLKTDITQLITTTMMERKSPF